MKLLINKWRHHYRFCRSHTGRLEAATLAATVVYRLHKADQAIKAAKARNA